MADGRPGRLPASVYRRRRIVVLVLALVVVVGIVLGVRAVLRSVFDSTEGDQEPPSTAPSTSEPAQDATGDAEEAAAGEDTTTDAPADASYADCAAPTLTVAIAADAAEFPANTAATFTITITNTGTTDCLIDAGEANREVVVVSGSDRVWSSKDCLAADAPARTLLLAPGMADTTQLAWNRERSAEGCPAGQSPPQPGTYQATVSLAGTSGGPTVFVLH